MSKYINPYTDFGFKRLFGTEGNKDLLVDFLNCLMPAKHLITDLNFRNSEQPGGIATDRKAIYDIYCQSAKGDRFIVEMQKAKINFFKDRALFYITFPINEQAEKGDWDFKLLPIYYIAILDFPYDEHEEIRKFDRNVQLRDEDGFVFYDKLGFRFLQMPFFNKKETELVTHYDKWCYFLKHLQSKLVYSELKAVMDTSKEEGREEGELNKARKIAKGMKVKGYSIDEIAELTNLSIDEIEKL